MVNNSIFTIAPYKFNGIQWMFDSKELGISMESFVGNSDDLIDSLAKGKDKCLLLFSDKPFPGSNVELDFLDQDIAGTTYNVVQPEKFGKTAWLCNVLFAFFDDAPVTLYAQVKV
jgi:hypothetical protein